MLAIPGIGNRCVIWFGTPTPQEKYALAAGGWQMRIIPLHNQRLIGMRDNDFLVGIVDLRDTATEDLSCMEQLVAEHRHLPIFAITHPTSALSTQAQHIVEASIGQFFDPLNIDALLQQLQAVTEPSSVGRTKSALSALLGHCKPMLRMQATLRKYATVDLPVLITGETGTGKESAAQALHQLSCRHESGFHAINCGAIPTSLVQSELFGHERGAFTGASTRREGLFETANHGTVFLDEVGDLPPDAQTSLLRVLQEGSIIRVGSNTPIHIDVRILAATHVDLEQAVVEGRFRSDLFYRLNVLRLHMPPLRHRDDDITLLARHFLQDFRKKHSVRARGFKPSALAALSGFQWPGNVRELLNRVHRAAVIAESELISSEDLGLHENQTISHQAVLHSSTVAACDRETLLKHLAQTRYNISLCAQRMQVARITVYRLCRKYRIDLDQLRQPSLLQQ